MCCKLFSPVTRLLRTVVPEVYLPDLAEDMDPISESYSSSNFRNSAAEMAEGEGITAVMVRTNCVAYLQAEKVSQLRYETGCRYVVYGGLMDRSCTW